MGSNESFEVFAREFYMSYGYLPLGKDDPYPLRMETVLADLADTFRKLQAAKAQPPTHNSAMVEIADVLTTVISLSVNLGALNQSALIERLDAVVARLRQ